MNPFTTLLDSTESRQIRKNGIFVTYRKLGFIVVAAFLVATSLCVAVYYLTRWITLKNLEEDDWNLLGLNGSLNPHHILEEPCSLWRFQQDVNGTRASAKDVQSLGTEEIKSPSHPIRPLHYHLSIVPVLKGNFSYSGRVTITFEVLRSRIREISLNVKGFEIIQESVTLHPIDSDGAIGIYKQFYEGDDGYVATTYKDLIEGGFYNISAKFRGTMKKDGRGLHYLTYSDGTVKNKVIALTNLWPKYAREVFPCLDDASMYSKFTLQVGRERNARVLSNMPKRSVDPVIGTYGYYYDSFETSPLMTARSLAFLITEDFKSEHATIYDKYSVALWKRTTPTYKTKCGEEILHSALSKMEKFFNQTYPFPELDIVFLPHLLESSEVSALGLIILRESELVCNSVQSSGVAHITIQKALQKSIAYQWLINSGMNEFWLIQGMAIYLEYLGENELLFETEVVQRALQIDSLAHSQTLANMGFQKESGRLLPAYIASFKGAALIKMLENVINKRRLQAAISQYVNLSSSRKKSGDFFGFLFGLVENSMSVEFKAFSLESFAKSWTTQTGYPIINLSRINGSLFASQDSFSQGKPRDKSKWYIPISFSVQSLDKTHQNKTIKWLVPDVRYHFISNTSSQKWIILNGFECVLCRINYDAGNWRRIIYQLKTDHTAISPVNRAKLLDDSAALAKAGILSYDVMLTLYSYLKYEEDLIPWQTGLMNLKYILEMFSATAAIRPLKLFVLSRILPLYNKLKGSTTFNSDDHLQSFLFSLVLETTCALQDESCIKEASGVFEIWMVQPSNFSIIQMAAREAVLCTGIAEGEEARWNSLWSYYKMNSYQTMARAGILRALACTKQEEVLRRFLAMSLRMESDFGQDDILAIFEGLVRNPVGRKAAWKFLKINFKLLLKRFDKNVFVLEKLIYSTTGFINTQQYLNEFEGFYKKTTQIFPPLKKILDLSSQRVRQNLSWNKKYAGEIYQWLENNGYSRL